jgi:hypothetical protein
VGVSTLRRSQRRPVQPSVSLGPIITDFVAPAFLRFVAGVVWAVSGALMAFNPAPPGARRVHSLPVVGLVTLVSEIQIARHQIDSDGKQPDSHQLLLPLWRSGFRTVILTSVFREFDGLRDGLRI